jgi:hypothetical protein
MTKIGELIIYKNLSINSRPKYHITYRRALSGSRHGTMTTLAYPIKGKRNLIITNGVIFRHVSQLK